MAVTFPGRGGVGLAGSLCAGVPLLTGVLDSLATTTRALILAAAGLMTLGSSWPSSCAPEPAQARGQGPGHRGRLEQESARSDNLRSRTYHPVVRFTTTDGRRVAFTSGLGLGGRQPRIGGAVPVRYDHEDPEQAEIDRAYSWMLPAAPSLLVGVGLLVAAVVAFADDPRSHPPRRSPRSRRRWWTVPRLRGPGNRFRWGRRRPRWRAAGLVTR